MFCSHDKTFVYSDSGTVASRSDIHNHKTFVTIWGRFYHAHKVYSRLLFYKRADDYFSCYKSQLHYHRHAYIYLKYHRLIKKNIYQIKTVQASPQHGNS